MEVCACEERGVVCVWKEVYVYAQGALFVCVVGGVLCVLGGYVMCVEGDDVCMWREVCCVCVEWGVEGVCADEWGVSCV